MQNKPLLTHNSISSHEVFRRRRTNPKSNTKLVSNLAKHITDRIRNYPSEVSYRALQKMVNMVINHRITNQRMYRQEHNAELRKLEIALANAQETRNIAAQAVPILHANETNAQRAERLRRINQIYRNTRSRLTNSFVNTNAVTKYINHANQISYWKWIKNSVLGQVHGRLRRIRSQTA